MTEPSSVARPRPVYRWTRDCHLYAGLFAAPFVLVFAVSAILLNHAWRPWGGPDSTAPWKGTVQVAIQHSRKSLGVGRRGGAQTGIVGGIGFVSRRPGPPRLSFPIDAPGRTTKVRVDL